MIDFPPLLDTGAYESVLLFIISLAAIYFLLLLTEKNKAKWLLLALFSSMILLELTRILEAALAGSIFGML